MGEMISEGKLEHPVISWQFNFNDKESYVIFGGFNSTAYTGELIQYDIVQTVNWTIGLSGVWVGGTEVNGDTTQNAAIATGTSYIYMPESDFLQFKA